MSNTAEHPVERIVIRHFAELLATRNGTRFRSAAKKLDPTTNSRPATKMCDYELQMEDGSSFLVEIKRWLPAEKEHKEMSGRIVRAVKEMHLTRALDISVLAHLWSKEAIPAPGGNAAGAKAMQWCEFRQRVKRSVLRSLGTGRRIGWRRKGFSSFSLTARPSSGTSTSVSVTVSIARIRVNPSVVRNEFVDLLQYAEAQLQAASTRPDFKRVLLLLDHMDNPGILGGKLQEALEEDERLSQSTKIDEMWVVGLDPLSPGINQFWPLGANHTGQFFMTDRWSARNRARLTVALHKYFALNWVRRVETSSRSA